MTLHKLPHPPRSYADVANLRLHNTASQYVNIKERLDSNTQKPYAQQMLAQSRQNFKLKNSHLTSWDDLNLCDAKTCLLSDIDIDITLQRQFDLGHVCNILKDFKESLVMPICVYRDPENVGKYVCWDGQHTALVLFAIARDMFGIDNGTVPVPIAIFHTDLKSEMRKNLMTFNSTAKKPFEEIDFWHQEVFGVRVDGSTDPKWIETEKKQGYLEEAQMFVTNTKFGDTHLPGAYTRLAEIHSSKYPTEITKYFCTYFTFICHSSRPVDPKESWLMYEFFHLCRKNRIVVDDVYIGEITLALNNAFRRDVDAEASEAGPKNSRSGFDAKALVDKSRDSWQEWWRHNKPNPDGTLWGIQYNEYQEGVTFLLAQLKKNCNPAIQLPIDPAPKWIVPQGDLF